jgi:hypothetical protein
MPHTRPVPTTSERVGKNEALFREVNERIRGVSEFLADANEYVEFVCECSQPACHDPVPLTYREYEAVRANGAHFLAAPEHVCSPDDERVVLVGDRYWVLEKNADAGEVAEGTDPRE